MSVVPPVPPMPASKADTMYSVDNSRIFIRSWIALNGDKKVIVSLWVPEFKRSVYSYDRADAANVLKRARILEQKIEKII